jgi:hypothetical protein
MPDIKFVLLFTRKGTTSVVRRRLDVFTPSIGQAYEAGKRIEVESKGKWQFEGVERT